MYDKLISYTDKSIKEFDSITADRKEKLAQVVDYIEQKLKTGDKARLIFICTHNSRRSHLAQIWAQTAAEYFGIAGVKTYSGGTEATAFNPNAVKALERAGFDIHKESKTDNPVYFIKMSAESEPLKAFSKKYTDKTNPQNGFCAVMTCSSADEGCPVVFGSDKRIAVTYDDPKEFDGTQHETIAYDERCRQICSEMFWLFSLVAHKLPMGNYNQ